MTDNRALLIEARKAIRRHDFDFALTCLDLSIEPKPVEYMRDRYQYLILHEALHQDVPVFRTYRSRPTGRQ